MQNLAHLLNYPPSNIFIPFFGGISLGLLFNQLDKLLEGWRVRSSPLGYSQNFTRARTRIFFIFSILIVSSIIIDSQMDILFFSRTIFIAFATFVFTTSWKLFKYRPYAFWSINLISGAMLIAFFPSPDDQIVYFTHSLAILSVIVALWLAQIDENKKQPYLLRRTKKLGYYTER